MGRVRPNSLAPLKFPCIQGGRGHWAWGKRPEQVLGTRQKEALGPLPPNLNLMTRGFTHSPLRLSRHMVDNSLTLSGLKGEFEDRINPLRAPAVLALLRETNEVGRWRWKTDDGRSHKGRRAWTSVERVDAHGEHGGRRVCLAT